MSPGFQALCYLGAWEARYPSQGGLAFESLLRRCRLDYSLGSLDRIDTFLDALRKTQKPRPEVFLQSQANLNLLAFLAFYVGEVLGRGVRQPPEWFTYQQMLEVDPATSMFGEGFISSVTCRFANARSAVDFFLPLNAIVTRLFEEGGDKSVRFSAGLVFDQQGPQGQLPLPPLPPQHLGIDIPAFMRQTGTSQQALAMDEPEWVRGDKLAYLFDSTGDLLRDGHVVWGALIQANNMLFLPGATRGGAPGEVLYDPQGRAPPDDLVAVAKTVYSLKGKRMEDPALAYFSDYLADEMIRVFGIDVPASVIPHPLKASTTYFDRRHLPDGRLSQPVLPVVISDSRPGAVMVLPLPLWPRHLREAWAPPAPPAPDFGPPGTPEALFNEGFARFTGKGVPQDPPRARELWVEAASAGHVEAMYNLGGLYATGTGTARHVEIALRYLRQAAERGHLPSQLTLGRLLLLKTEPTHDRKEAARWLQCAADQDSDEAHDLLDRHGLREPDPPGLLGRLFGRS